MHYTIHRKVEKLEKSARLQRAIPIIDKVREKYFLGGKKVDLEQVHREHATVVIDDI
jgi:hypothetical protein